MSSQNIDRVVSAYRAATRAGRLFVIDVYAAYILEHIKNPRIPKPSWKNVRVFYPLKLSDFVAKYVGKDVLYRYKSYRISSDELNQSKYVLLFRNSMLNDLQYRLTNLEGAVFIHSLWQGYWNNPDGESLREFVEKKGMVVRQIHTSGHADSEALEHFINALEPKRILPVHTENAEWFERLMIGEKYEND